MSDLAVPKSGTTTVKSVLLSSGMTRGSHISAVTASATALGGASVVPHPPTVFESRSVETPAYTSSGTDGGVSVSLTPGQIAEIFQPSSSGLREKLDDLAHRVQVSIPLDHSSGNSFYVVQSYLRRFVEIGSVVAEV